MTRECSVPTRDWLARRRGRQRWIDAVPGARGRSGSGSIKGDFGRSQNARSPHWQLRITYIGGSYQGVVLGVLKWPGMACFAGFLAFWRVFFTKGVLRVWSRVCAFCACDRISGRGPLSGFLLVATFRAVTVVDRRLGRGWLRMRGRGPPRGRSGSYVECVPLLKAVAWWMLIRSAHGLGWPEIRCCGMIQGCPHFLLSQTPDFIQSPDASGLR